MSSREQFEEWECNAPEGPQTDPMWLMRCGVEPDKYGIVQVQHNWEVWRASRAAIEVKLPDDGIEDCEAQWGERCRNTFDCGYNFASVQHEKVMQAAGIKVEG